MKHKVLFTTKTPLGGKVIKVTRSSVHWNEYKQILKSSEEVQTKPIGYDSNKWDVLVSNTELHRMALIRHVELHTKTNLTNYDTGNSYYRQE